MTPEQELQALCNDFIKWDTHGFSQADAIRAYIHYLEQLVCDIAKSDPHTNMAIKIAIQSGTRYKPLSSRN